MAFWTGEKLLAADKNIIEPFDPDRVDCNAYTLAMGDRYFRTADHDSAEEPNKVFLSESQQFQIPPGQFAFLITEEIVKIPAHAMAFISMRTHTKFQGLINVSGFHVDPGYKGKLVYAVFNASPSTIPVTRGDPIFKIWFCDLTATSDEIWDGPGIDDIGSSLLEGMNKEIFSLQSLAEKIRSFDFALHKALAAQESAATAALRQVEDRLRAALATQDEAVHEAIRAVNSELTAQRPTITHLSTVYTNLSVGVIVAAIVALLGLGVPTAITAWRTVFQPSASSSATAAPSPPAQAAAASAATPPAEPVPATPTTPPVTPPATEQSKGDGKAP